MAALLTTTVSVVAVGFLEVPMRVRAILSESQLEAAARRLEAGEPVGRAGLYWPNDTWYDEEARCTVFETQLVLIDTHGVAHCGETSGPDSGFLRHLSGNVYDYSDAS